MLMKEPTDKNLNRKVKRRINNNNKTIEPVWLTPELKKEMSKRRICNKELRRAPGEDYREKK